MKLYRGMKVTGAKLRAAGACEEQATRVDEVWPEGARLTLGNIQRAAREGLYVGWFADLLPASARAAYDEAEASAWVAYREVLVSAQAAYDEAVDPARAAYREALARALWNGLP